MHGLIIFTMYQTDEKLMKIHGHSSYLNKMIVHIADAI